MVLRPPNRSVRPLVCILTVATLAVAGCSGESSTGRDRSTAAPSFVVVPTPTPTPTPVTSASKIVASPTTATPTPSPTRAASSTRPQATAGSSTARPAIRTVQRLPLGLSTGNATEVVTVVSSGRSDTTATVRRWTKTSSGWQQVGDAVDAYVGAGGIGTAHEGSTRTPAGSFTLTQAFGRNSNPGTALPYTRTTDADYWISNPGPLYNTLQRCGNCGYDKGINEHLHAVTPEYDYAAVIDYNTRNAPGGVRAGQGSAFFLHVSAGEPTAGCVALPRADLVRVLTWLNPARHPRILIGVD